MKSFWRSPVYILFAATAVVLIANGSRQSLGLFLEPLTTDLNWGVSEFATAIAVQNLVMGIAAPFTGALADRWRPTTVIALAAALYTAGRVRHCGNFPRLEDQMCGLMTGGDYVGPGRSPDRADALVWAMSELMLGQRANPSVRSL